MHRAPTAALVSLTLLASACALVACGGQAHSSASAEGEVRALFAAIAANGRTSHFASICDHEVSALLNQLTYLVGGNCPKDLASEWAEGVQLASISPSTRIVVSGDTATVFDGPTPDRAVRVDGAWKLAEDPRNKRFSEVDEARKTTETINKLLRSHHLPSVQVLSKQGRVH